MNVYIIQSGLYFKIGKANDVSNRLKTLQTSTPTPLRLIATKQDNEAFSLESKIHSKLSSYRVRGEWFLTTKEVIEGLIKEFGFNQKNKIENKIPDDVSKIIQVLHRRANDNSMEKIRSDLEVMLAEKYERKIKEVMDNIEVYSLGKAIEVLGQFKSMKENHNKMFNHQSVMGLKAQ